MNLDELRQEIDRLDTSIMQLFVERMEVCRGVARYKQEHDLPVFQGGREGDVIAKAKSHVPESMASGAALLSTTMIDISKHLQYREINKETQEHSYTTFAPQANARVACAGTEGANSETAVKQIFGEQTKPTFYSSFDEVFQAVQNGTMDYGVIPIQNSTAGSVAQAYDLMEQYSFYIARTTVVEITNCLAVKPGTQFADVKEVFSHPQALAQCEEFLTCNHLIANSYNNTATAAKMVMEHPNPYGAICSEGCARLHGMDILATNISDYVPNFTRFICITKKLCIPEDANTISVMLKLPHAEGSLHRLLSKFVMCDMNLQKLESRPIRNGSFDVMFYLDFEGNIKGKSPRALLSELSQNLEYFKFLGNHSEI